ncbi:SMP-30/gluconolactonase/LRE family protein [Chitinophaga sp. MM2321]|uniref:SMP-30/gluconolactonase/LRE family protein n=1 Tax=Chitinophaga sp. MM2321 TaxID=3137178 RepID=UPI0032D5883E
MQILHKRIIEIAALRYYTEGPALDKDGNLFFTTLSGGWIMKVDEHGKMSKWAKSVCPNGQFILPGNDHLICDSELSAVRRFGPDGTFIKDEIRDYCAGVKVFTPNDVIADTAGNIYFTDSVRYIGKVFRIGKNGHQEVVADNMDYPNGLVLSKDERWLFVAESYQNSILKIDVKSPAENRVPVLTIALPRHASGREQDNLPDGLAMDHQGTLWVAHYGMQAVHNYTVEGAFICSIDTSMPLTSNLIFTDKQTLMVTGGYGEPGPGAVMKISL